MPSPYEVPSTSKFSKSVKKPIFWKWQSRIAPWKNKYYINFLGKKNCNLPNQYFSLNVINALEAYLIATN